MRRKRLTKKVLDGLWMGLMHAKDVMEADAGPGSIFGKEAWSDWDSAHDWLRREFAVRREREAKK